MPLECAALGERKLRQRTIIVRQRLDRGCTGGSELFLEFKDDKGGGQPVPQFFLFSSQRRFGIGPRLAGVGYLAKA